MRTSVVRRAWSGVRWAVVLAVVAFWFVALRPQALGGPASFALVSGTSMLPRMHTGDVVVVHRKRVYHVGDVISYRVPKPDPAAPEQGRRRLADVARRAS